MPEDKNDLPNLVTVIGTEVPSNYEISVTGQIEMKGSDPVTEGVISSGKAVEGSIAGGMRQFRFSGEMVNVHVVDWNGVPASESASAAEVHINFDV